jgi:hypothetical protein
VSSIKISVDLGYSGEQVLLAHQAMEFQSALGTLIERSGVTAGVPTEPSGSGRAG